MAAYNKKALAHLGRRLVHNQAAFSLNNALRHQELLRHSIPQFRTVFLSVPFLLQMNHPGIPGYVDSEDVPRGVHGFERSDFCRIKLDLTKDLKLERREILALQPVVESLFLMGSSGSVGYTASSDLDYWVCIDQQKLNHQKFALFQQKLKLISEWAEKEHEVEVTFFPIDLADLAANRLTHLDDEEPGDVLPLMLKEEMYRTLLHVVGRIPLWWTVSSGTYFDDYQQIAMHLELVPNPNFFPQDFIDLGFPQKPPPKEYIAAALWQLHKAKHDPFKAAMKTILLLEQAESGLRAPLLCDQLKEKILSSPKDQLPIDPYILTIRRVLDYSQKSLPIEDLDLIRTSIYFKLYSPLGATTLDKNSLKVRFLEELIKDWGWSQTKVRQMEHYHEWPESRKLALGEEVNNLLRNLYTRISNRLRADFPTQVKLDQDLATLHLQMLARYSTHEAKVETLPSDQHRRSLPSELTLVFEDNRWNLYAGLTKGSITGEQERLIYTCERAARAAAWLVNNNLFTPSLKLLLKSGPDFNRETFFNLLEILQKKFAEVDLKNLSREKTPVPRKTGRQLLIINLEEPPHQVNIITAELIYRTTWGELCHENLTIKHNTNNMVQYSDLIEQVLDSEDLRWDDVMVFVHPTMAGKEIKDTFKTVVSLNLQQREASVETKNQTSKLKLDIN